MYKRTFNKIEKAGLLDGTDYHFIGKNIGAQVVAYDEDGDESLEAAEELVAAILEQFPGVRAKRGMGGQILLTEKAESEHERLVAANMD